MIAYKRTAIYLHGLGEKDRSWLLSRLSDVHSVKLKTLLDDLNHLDIPGDRSLLSQIETMELGGLVDYNDSDYVDSAIQEIDMASTSEITLLLESESLQFVCILLAVRNWRWSAAFSNLLTAQRYRRLVELQNSLDGGVNERIINLAVTKLARRIREQAKLLSREKIPIKSPTSFESELCKQNGNKRPWLSWRL